MVLSSLHTNNNEQLEHKPKTHQRQEPATRPQTRLQDKRLVQVASGNCNLNALTTASKSHCKQSLHQTGVGLKNVARHTRATSHREWRHRHCKEAPATRSTFRWSLLSMRPPQPCSIGSSTTPPTAAALGTAYTALLCLSSPVACTRPLARPLLNAAWPLSWR